MTILGLILILTGGGGFLLVYTDSGGPLMPTLTQMPLGLIGWFIVAMIGVVLMVLNRRPAD